MPLGTYLAETNMDQFIGSTVVLYEESPTDESDGIEVEGGGYNPQPSTITANLEETATGTNAEDIVFTNLPDVSVVAIGFKNTSGDLLYYDPLPEPMTFAAGANTTIPAGTLTVTVN